MSEQPAGPTLPTYRAQPGRYDELADERGQPREHWEPLMRLFGRLGAQEIDARRKMADRLLVGEGASYTNDGDEAGGRPWRIDPVPLLWARAEWVTVEAGLAQRARLLDALVADVYGPQRLLREGAVPPELLFGRSGFRWPVASGSAATAPRAGPWLATYAADLVRDAERPPGRAARPHGRARRGRRCPRQPEGAEPALP